MKNTVLVVLAVTACLRLYAQDTIVLRPVEVSASAVHAAETSMERKVDTTVVQRMSTAPLSQILIEQSPVFIKTYGPGGTATASFRGTTASHTLVLWNGFQLNAPTLGQVDFSTIPVFMTDELSLKWGSATSAQSGGLGGVVSIDNDVKFGKGLMLNLKQSVGSFSTIGSYVTTGYSWKHILFRIKAYRSSSENDFEYYNNALIPHQRMKQKNASFLDFGFMPEVKAMFGHSVLTAVSWNQWNDRNHPQIMANVANANTEEYTKSGFSRNFIAYKYFWNDGSISLKSGLFHESQDYHLNSFTISGQPVTTIVSDNEALMTHQIAELTQRIVNSWKLNVKIQWDMDRVTSDNYSDIKRRDIFSNYVSVNGDLFGGLSFQATIRNDIVDGTSSGFFPTATLNYRFRSLEGLSATAGYSHNYRLPSLNDLYWYPGGNESLKAEDGKTFDVSVRFEKKNEKMNVDLNLGAYYSLVDDWIQWVPTVYRFWVPENVSEVCARGIETHLKVDYNFRNVTFGISGNYIYSKTTNDGRQLIYIPLHHGNVSASVMWKGWSLNYTFEATGERKTSNNDDEFFAFKLNPYYLHHLNLGKEIGKFNVNIIIHNLTNEDYQAVLWRAMPGISFEAVIEFKL